MNREQWRLARQIQAIITTESGASLEELAKRTGDTFTEVRAVGRVLYAQRRADFCWRYLTAVPGPAEGRRVA